MIIFIIGIILALIAFVCLGFRHCGDYGLDLK